MVGVDDMFLRTSSVEAAYVDGVYVILILRVWPVSKGQQSLTTLNAKQAAYMWKFS